MWFKQVQLFKLSQSTEVVENFEKYLKKMAFQPCPLSFPFTMGWVNPIGDDHENFAHELNGKIMFCLQLEEKILPSVVIRQELIKKIKEIELTENRKVWSKEKDTIKDEITASLLTKAFSKLTKVYAYLDPKNRWLVLGTAQDKKVNHFISYFNKTTHDKLESFNFKNISSITTTWLKQQNHPSCFTIEKNCVLQDPNEQSRVIRCQQQNLFATGIQSLIKDGCKIKQLALSWQDRVKFVLTDDFSLTSIRFQDEIISQAKDLEAESVEQQFNADFLIMAETFSAMFKDLLSVLAEPMDSHSIKDNKIAITSNVE